MSQFIHHKLNAKEARAIANSSKYGFTFVGDSFFGSYMQARRCLNRLVKIGLLSPHTDEYGTDYRLTDDGYHFVKWGFTEAHSAAAA